MDLSHLRFLIVGDLRVMKHIVSIVAINILICFDVNCETCGLDIDLKLSQSSNTKMDNFLKLEYKLQNIISIRYLSLDLTLDKTKKFSIL